MRSCRTAWSTSRRRSGPGARVDLHAPADGLLGALLRRELAARAARRQPSERARGERPRSSTICGMSAWPVISTVWVPPDRRRAGVARVLEPLRDVDAPSSGPWLLGLGARPAGSRARIAGTNRSDTAYDVFWSVMNPSRPSRWPRRAPSAGRRQRRDEREVRQLALARAGERAVSCAPTAPWASQVQLHVQVADFILPRFANVSRSSCAVSVLESRAAGSRPRSRRHERPRSGTSSRVSRRRGHRLAAGSDPLGEPSIGECA